MIVGVPKEIRQDEYRVAATPAVTKELVSHGHQVLVEASAGEGSNIPDEEFARTGARILSRAEDVWQEADLIYKVKEPIEPEFSLLREDQMLLTFLHLASSRELTHLLLERRVKAIGYETVELDDGSLPLLAPMSQIAGRMAVQIGACLLAKNNGGRGVLLGGIPGAHPGTVVVLGAGNVGSNAAIIAAGLRARLIVINRGLERLKHLEETIGGCLTTLASAPYHIEEAVHKADLLIGSVLVPGAKPPLLVSEEMVKGMKKGSVIIDVSVDQGGCVETSQVTTHREPIFVKHGVIHYGVTNMPGVVPQTSTWVLSDVTLPYILALANLGFEEAVRQDRSLGRGVNTYRGELTHLAVAEAHSLPFTALDNILV